MPKRRATTVPDFQLLLILGAALVISGAAFAQEPDPEPEAEATQQQEDEPEAAPAPAAADDSDDADDADDTDDAGDDEHADDEYTDYEQPAEYADDAIPTDTQLDPTRTSWDVVDFEDDGDNQEDVEEAPHPGVREPEDMPTVRPHARKAPPNRANRRTSCTRRAAGRFPTRARRGRRRFMARSNWNGFRRSHASARHCGNCSTTAVARSSRTIGC